MLALLAGGRAPRYVLDPRLTAAEVARLDSDVRWARALDGSEYMPGLVGLNNMKANDYANVVIQLLARVAPVRWGMGRGTSKTGDTERTCAGPCTSVLRSLHRHLPAIHCYCLV